MLKVIHIRDSGFYGSPEALIVGQIGELSQRGFNFVVASFSNEKRETDFLQEIGQIADGTATLGGVLTGISTIIRLIRKKNIQLAVTHDYKSNFCGLVASRICRIPAIAVFHGRTSHDRKIIVYEKLDDRILRLANGIICVSENGKKNLINKGFPEDKLKVICNAVDEQRCAHFPIKIPIREELNIPQTAKVVANIGRVSPEKGQIYFIKAAMEVAPQLPDCYFLILGAGPDLAALERMVGGAGYSARIRFLGFRKDALSILKQSDMLVLSSLTEGMPMVVLEAFALKVPVVCWPVGGIPEIVVDRVTGYLCPYGDTSKLAETMIEVIRSGENPRVTQNAFELVKRQLSFDSQAEMLDQFYRETALRNH